MIVMVMLIIFVIVIVSALVVTLALWWWWWWWWQWWLCWWWWWWWWSLTANGPFVRRESCSLVQLTQRKKNSPEFTKRLTPSFSRPLYSSNSSLLVPLLFFYPIIPLSSDLVRVFTSCLWFITGLGCRPRRLVTQSGTCSQWSSNNLVLLRDTLEGGYVVKWTATNTQLGKWF